MFGPKKSRSTYIRMLAITVGLIILFVLFLVLRPTAETKTKTNANAETEIPFPISCGCKLETSHPGCIEHKSKCPIYRRLNPRLTYNQFKAHEWGYRYLLDAELVGSIEEPWPPVDYP
jgi:hypothetical protein